MCNRFKTNFCVQKRILFLLLFLLLTIFFSKMSFRHPRGEESGNGGAIKKWSIDIEDYLTSRKHTFHPLHFRWNKLWKQFNMWTIHKVYPIILQGYITSNSAMWFCFVYILVVSNWMTAYHLTLPLEQ
jgi:hypothetical protein